MEMACFLRRMSIKAMVDWTSREADSLTNGDMSVFSLEWQIHLDWKTMRWDIWPEPLEMGRKAEN